MKKKNNNTSIVLNNNLISKVISELGNDNFSFILNLINELHPADTADLLETLNSDDRKKVINIVNEKFPSETLPSMNVPILLDVIEEFDFNHLVRMLAELDTDDITYVLEICEESLRKEVLRKLPKELQKLIKKALTYDEDSAGRIMQTDYVSIPVSWNIGQVLDYLRMSRRIPDEFYALFAVDSRHIPVGTVPLHLAMRKKREVKITDIMTIKPKMVIGMITVDDVVDLIRQKADEDMYKLGGVTGDGDLYLAAFKTARSRFGWLAINLITAILASISIAFFETALDKLVSLAILMPIVASMGGNAGTQTLTVAVRAMATRELTSSNSLRVFGKEILVGAYNGIFFAILIGLVTGLWFQDYLLGSIIAFAMLFNLILAGTFGAAIPLILSYFKIDPAVAATVILTTITDILGFVIFLALANYLLI